MKVQCPSVSIGVSTFVHEPCVEKRCSWWDGRCTAAVTIPVGDLLRKRHCRLATRCRWMLQALDGVCPPMKLGEICEHQGGTFNTFFLEADADGQA